jgi:hypothetical protein
MRTIDSTVSAQLAAGLFSIRQLIRLELGSGAYGLAVSVQPIVFGGLTYEPLGAVEVSDLQFAPGTSALDFTLKLPASSDDATLPSILTNLFSEDYRDRPVRLFDAYLHSSTGALITAIEIRRGYIDHIRHISEPEEGALYEVECLSRAIDYSRRNGRLANDLDQKRRSSGDKFFEHATQTGRVQIYWGRVKR